MVVEIAHVTVLPGHEHDFEAALRQAVDDVLTTAPGCRGLTALGWGVERPNVFVFTIEWDTLEDHTVGFRGTDLFTRWRALIGPHFDGPPVVEHVSR